MDAKLEALKKLSQLQLKVASLFAKTACIRRLSNDYIRADTIYCEYIKNSQIYLQYALEFNARFPDSAIEISPIAQPLVNALRGLQRRLKSRCNQGWNEAVSQKMRDYYQ